MFQIKALPSRRNSSARRCSLRLSQFLSLAHERVLGHDSSLPQSPIRSVLGLSKEKEKSINQEETLFTVIDEGTALLADHYSAVYVLHRVSICRIQSRECHLTVLLNVVTLTMVHTKRNLFVRKKKRATINNDRKDEHPPTLKLSPFVDETRKG